jgi:hypothetical protein
MSKLALLSIAATCAISAAAVVDLHRSRRDGHSIGGGAIAAMLLGLLIVAALIAAASVR